MLGNNTTQLAFPGIPVPLPVQITGVSAMKRHYSSVTNLDDLAATTPGAGCGGGYTAADHVLSNDGIGLTLKTNCGRWRAVLKKDVVRHRAGRCGGAACAAIILLLFWLSG